MKNLTLIVHAEVKQALADTLRALKPVRGFTFTSVEGHGAHAGEDSLLSARDRVVGYVPYVRVDILLQAADIDAVLAALGRADTGLRGRCTYWVMPVEQQGRF